MENKKPKVDFEKYFSKFSSLRKTKKIKQNFLDGSLGDIEIRYSLFKYYMPKALSYSKKKNGKVTWKDIADRVFSEYIRLIYVDKKGYCTCVTCGIKDFWEYMQAGHYRTRGCLYYRFSEENVFVQCHRCNVTLNGNYRNYRGFIEENFGKEKEKELRESKKLLSIKDREYMEMILLRHETILKRKEELQKKKSTKRLAIL